jgi:hypothetical protein
MQLFECDVIHRLALLCMNDTRFRDYIFAIRIQIREQRIVRELVAQSGKRERFFNQWNELKIEAGGLGLKNRANLRAI